LRQLESCGLDGITDDSFESIATLSIQRLDTSYHLTTNVIVSQKHLRHFHSLLQTDVAGPCPGIILVRSQNLVMNNETLTG